ncbi:fructokinase [Acetitomaculum ruminis DSM 5522]|uniref:Fructokinase n=1 Tax=Acetitomaculum ruminis DSM 5522 TaxID=1120918 RepID=A0A1I0YW74_9FIRM|nr:carbohydrate kinase [Acetitomaculum ruminis]SFB16498.1 fructokinase [Acetitomaculum ruminis DSM 5522]
MCKLIAIGEALIDFIPQQTGAGISKVKGFEPKVGGAPANVCVAFTKLGGKSVILTKLGDDPFGDKIYNELESYAIDCSKIVRTVSANTSLAFVALKEDGNREFSFYRKPGADMLYRPEDVDREIFKGADVFHFCSVSLGDFPMKDAHKQAIKYANEENMLISFDPNLRLNLWENLEELKKAVWDFIPEADILKVSDEELEFLTGLTDIEKALPQLFTGKVKMIIYTMGSAGALAICKDVRAKSPCKKVKAIDTTGAGDAFIGSFLYRLLEKGYNRDNLEKLTKEQLEELLDYSNCYCSISIQKNGAAESYPTYKEMEEIFK